MSNIHKKNLGLTYGKRKSTFRVWAPFADAVFLTGTFNDWSKTELKNEGDGYWSVTVKKVRPGQEYKFIIKNGQLEMHRNDPRSLQLTTTGGNSVVADAHYTWTTDRPKPTSKNHQVIYEMHVGTFNRSDLSSIGNFEEAINKLDYLADLGINMIELMPANSMSMDRGWGYAIEYIYAIESLYGGRKKFLEFIEKAHSKGIGVILDVVYNHFGPGESLDIWQFDGWHQNNKGGIYFYNDWRSSTPWGELRPDYGRPEVRQYIIDNVVMWLQEFRLDGLRLDSTIFIRNARGQNNDPANDIPEGWELLKEITYISSKINKNAVIIAEDLAVNEFITKPIDVGGAGFDAQWELNFPRALRDVLDPVNDSDRSLQAISQELYGQYNGNPFERVVYSDSHDSAANGAARLSEEISPGNVGSLYVKKRSLLASAIILTAPGIPMLLQGQEFIQGGSFNDWQALDWAKADHFKGIVLAHKHLISLRKNVHGHTAGLTGPSIAIIHLNESDKVLGFHRWEFGGPGDDVVVVVNFANKQLKEYVMKFPRDGKWLVRFNSGWEGYSSDFKHDNCQDLVVANGEAVLGLAPYSVAIYSQEKT